MQKIMNNGLLHCPVCQNSPKPQILGRILPSEGTLGRLLILRFHSGTSLLEYNSLSLTCSCGFTYLLFQGTIVGTIMQPL